MKINIQFNRYVENVFLIQLSQVGKKCLNYLTANENCYELGGVNV
jgi:hypothetical protein